MNKLKTIKFKKREGMIASTAMVVSILAIFISIGTQSTECAFADDTCTVSSTETFTGDVGIKSATNNTFLIQHALTNDVTANVQDSGGTHVGTLILKDNASTFDLNGGVVLGTTATTTNGTIRYDSGTDKIQFRSSVAGDYADIAGGGGGNDYCGMTLYKASASNNLTGLLQFDYTEASNNCASVLENETSSGYSAITNKSDSGVTAMFDVDFVIEALCDVNPCSAVVRAYHDNGSGYTRFYNNYSANGDNAGYYQGYKGSFQVCLKPSARFRFEFGVDSGSQFDVQGASDTEFRTGLQIAKIGDVSGCDSWSGKLP